MANGRPAPAGAGAGKCLSGRVARGVGPFKTIVGRHCAGPVDLDSPRLHCLGHLALEGDAQKAVVEVGRFDNHEVGELEATLKCPRRNAAMQEPTGVAFLGLTAGDDQLVALRDDLDLLRTEASNRERDTVAVLAFLFDVERRLGLRLGARRGLEKVEETVEADGRAAIRGKVEIGPHVQILQ